MNYIAKTFTTHEVPGMSTQSIEEHKNLYSGYMKNYNLTQSEISRIQNLSEQTPADIYSLGELYRRMSFEWNGIVNHEYYFEQITGGAKPLSEDTQLYISIVATFGSWDQWMKSFVGLAKTRGIGWAMLWVDPRSGSLVQSWVDEQHLGQLSSCRVILALDMWEHSYVHDYHPSGKGSYITDYLSHINWDTVSQRFDDSLSVTR